MSRHGLVNALIVVAVVALFAVPLLLAGAGAQYAGTDAAVTKALEAEGYRPWFSSVFVPSREVESGLFAVQAALGAGVLGYVLGLLRGRRRTTAAAPGTAGRQ